MNQADRIRATLNANTPKGATQICRETGVSIKNVCQFLTYGSRKGEVIRHGDRPHLYTLNPDYSPRQFIPREKRDQPSLEKKALQQVLSANRNLRNVLSANVDGLTDNNEIATALEVQEQAEELARAVV